jgi:hypothetical protein
MGNKIPSRTRAVIDVQWPAERMNELHLSVLLLSKLEELPMLTKAQRNRIFNYVMAAERNANYSVWPTVLVDQLERWVYKHPEYKVITELWQHISPLEPHIIRVKIFKRGDSEVRYVRHYLNFKLTYVIGFKVASYYKTSYLNDWTRANEEVVLGFDEIQRCSLITLKGGEQIEVPEKIRQALL